MTEFAFRPREHLRRPADFKAVYALRCSASDPAIIVYARVNCLDHNRLGLSVSKKNGNAVVRNRIRRVLREAYRLSRQPDVVGYDVIVIPRSSELPSLAELIVALPLVIRDAAKRAARKNGGP